MSNRSRPGVLWFAVFGGPAAWSVDELAALSLHYDFCAGGPHAGFVSTPAIVAMLAVLAVAAAFATVAAGLVGWRQLRIGGPEDGRGDTADDRRRFMAHAGIVISALCLFPILLRLMSVLIIPASIC